jgi:hypothetical protein
VERGYASRNVTMRLGFELRMAEATFSSEHRRPFRMRPRVAWRPWAGVGLDPPWASGGLVLSTGPRGLASGTCRL